MRLRSSGGYDPDGFACDRIGDEKHSPIDQADDIEALFVADLDIIELDRVWIQEHTGCSSKIDAMLAPIGLLLGTIPLEILVGSAATDVLVLSILRKTRSERA
jgi:hypothetical protein